MSILHTHMLTGTVSQHLGDYSYRNALVMSGDSMYVPLTHISTHTQTHKHISIFA